MNKIISFQILFEPIILQMTWRFFLINVVFPWPPQQTIFISITLSSRTQVNSFIIFFNFITWRRVFFKSEVSIDKDSKRRYLDKRTGELTVIVVVELDLFFTLLIWTSFLFKLLLLMHSFQYIESEISMVTDSINIRLIRHILITGEDDQSCMVWMLWDMKDNVYYQFG